MTNCNTLRILPAFPSQIHEHDDVTYVNMKQCVNPSLQHTKIVTMSTNTHAYRYERILQQRRDRQQALQVPLPPKRRNFSRCFANLSTRPRPSQRRKQLARPPRRYENQVCKTIFDCELEVKSGTIVDVRHQIL